MNRSKIYGELGIFLDMAVEAHDIIRQELGSDVPGVRVFKTEEEHATVTTVSVDSPIGAQQMGRPVGTYITIDAPDIKMNNRLIHEEISKTIARELGNLLTSLGPDDPVLVIGLGNWHATPDALGPRVVEYTLVTRHLHQYAPQELSGGLRPVSALAPGVLGITGIETAEIIKGVVEKTQPKMVIAIDALSASNTQRITTSIQMANTGIRPGSGVGNKRAGISQETMGVPVIAIGVPTVVHGGIIASGVLENFLENLQANPMMNSLSQNIGGPALEQAMSQTLEPYKENFLVTPKDIDQLIRTIARVIAGGLTQALHPGMPDDHWTRYLQ